VLIFLEFDIHMATQVDAGLGISVGFFNDDMTDPIQEPQNGQLLSQFRSVDLSHQPVGVDLTRQFLFSGINTSLMTLGGPLVPTSVQIVASLFSDTGSVDLNNIRVVVVELKNSMEIHGGGLVG